MLRVLAISASGPEWGASDKVTACEWLFIMPRILPIDYLVWLHNGSGCRGFWVSRSYQHSCSVGTVLGFSGTKVAAKVMVWKPDLCNAPSGALGSLIWTCEVMQGNSKGIGFREAL